MNDTQRNLHVRRVVVGIDGSPAGDAALREAAREAVLRHARLDVVHIWAPPFTAIAPIGGMAITIDVESCEEAVRQLLDERTADVLDRLDEQPVAVDRILVHSHETANMLTATAKGADLLVVGTLGRGNFTGLILRSVSQHCVHHASCPVMVVPAASLVTP